MVKRSDFEIFVLIYFLSVLIFLRMFFFVFMFLLEIKLGFDSRDAAKRFFSSIKPELSEVFLRSSTSVSQKDNVLDFRISAQDKTALRASLNALLKPLVLFNELEGLK